MLSLGLAGHRPPCLGGYGPNRVSAWVESVLREVLADAHARHGVREVLTGMALGFDQIGARVAIELGLPVIAVVPFRGQEARWPSAAQAAYRELLSRAARVVYLAGDLSGAPSGAIRHALLHRNRWIVERSDVLVACWDGQSGGGTAHAVLIARRAGIPVAVIDPVRRQVFWENDLG